MSTADQYREFADACVKSADNACDDLDKRLWLTLAKSWLRLGEDAERMNIAPADGASDTDAPALGSAN